MSGITLAQAQVNLDALVNAQMTGSLAVSVGGRSLSFRTMKDLIEGISFWERKVAALTRIAAGGSKHGFAVADLSSTR